MMTVMAAGPLMPSTSTTPTSGGPFWVGLVVVGIMIYCAAQFRRSRHPTWSHRYTILLEIGGVLVRDVEATVKTLVRWGKSRRRRLWVVPDEPPEEWSGTDT